MQRHIMSATCFKFPGANNILLPTLPIFKQNQINHKATTNTITIATIIITLRWSNLVVHKSNSYDLKRHTWQQRVSRPWTSKCDFWHSNTQQIAKRLSHLLPLLPLSPDNENISETWQRIFIFLRKIMVFKYLIGLFLTVVGLITSITYQTVTNGAWNLM